MHYTEFNDPVSRTIRTTQAACSEQATIKATISFAFLLFALHLRFVGFPLHPIGYAISASRAIHLIWFPMFIAWLFKTAILRYGGYAAFRRAVPFFLGLILGDCIMGSIWG
jgi:hypothetical protein